MHNAGKDKRARRKARHHNKEVTSTESQGAYDLMCQECNRYKSRIGLYSHTWGCYATNATGATPYSARLKNPNQQQYIKSIIYYASINNQNYDIY